MAKKDLIYDKVEDKSETLDRVDPADLARAIGAEEVTDTSAGLTGSPFSMWAIRSRLLSDLVSTGGRPGRRDASLRKIAVTDAEWAALDEIAGLLRSEGVSATPGQVAGLLLHQSLAEVLRRLDSVTPSVGSDSRMTKELSNVDLKETLENVLAAAAKAQVHLEELGPVAMELLRRMRDDKDEDGDDR